MGTFNSYCLNLILMFNLLLLNFCLIIEGYADPGSDPRIKQPASRTTSDPLRGTGENIPIRNENVMVLNNGNKPMNFQSSQQLSMAEVESQIVQELNKMARFNLKGSDEADDTLVEIESCMRKGMSFSDALREGLRKMFPDILGEQESKVDSETMMAVVFFINMRKYMEEVKILNLLQQQTEGYGNPDILVNSSDGRKISVTGNDKSLQYPRAKNIVVTRISENDVDETLDRATGKKSLPPSWKNRSSPPATLQLFNSPSISQLGQQQSNASREQATLQLSDGGVPNSQLRQLQNKSTQTVTGGSTQRNQVSAILKEPQIPYERTPPVVANKNLKSDLNDFSNVMNRWILSFQELRRQYQAANGNNTSSMKIAGGERQDSVSEIQKEQKLSSSIEDGKVSNQKQQAQQIEYSNSTANNPSKPRMNNVTKKLQSSGGEKATKLMKVESRAVASNDKFIDAAQQNREISQIKQMDTKSLPQKSSKTVKITELKEMEENLPSVHSFSKKGIETKAHLKGSMPEIIGESDSPVKDGPQISHLANGNENVSDQILQQSLPQSKVKILNLLQQQTDGYGNPDILVNSDGRKISVTGNDKSLQYPHEKNIVVTRISENNVDETLDRAMGGTSLPSSWKSRSSPPAKLQLFNSPSISHFGQQQSNASREQATLQLSDGGVPNSQLRQLQNKSTQTVTGGSTQRNQVSAILNEPQIPYERTPPVVANTNVKSDLADFSNIMNRWTINFQEFQRLYQAANGNNNSSIKIAGGKRQDSVPEIQKEQKLSTSIEDEKVSNQKQQGQQIEYSNSTANNPSKPRMNNVTKKLQSSGGEKATKLMKEESRRVASNDKFIDAAQQNREMSLIKQMETKSLPQKSSKTVKITEPKEMEENLPSVHSFSKKDIETKTHLKRSVPEIIGESSSPVKEGPQISHLGNGNENVSEQILQQSLEQSKMNGNQKQKLTVSVPPINSSILKGTNLLSITGNWSPNSFDRKKLINQQQTQSTKEKFDHGEELDVGSVPSEGAVAVSQIMKRPESKSQTSVSSSHNVILKESEPATESVQYRNRGYGVSGGYGGGGSGGYRSSRGYIGGGGYGEFGASRETEEYRLSEGYGGTRENRIPRTSPSTVGTDEEAMEFTFESESNPTERKFTKDVRESQSSKKSVATRSSQSVNHSLGFQNTSFLKDYKSQPLESLMKINSRNGDKRALVQSIPSLSSASQGDQELSESSETITTIHKELEDPTNNDADEELRESISQPKNQEWQRRVIKITEEYKPGQIIRKISRRGNWPSNVDPIMNYKESTSNQKKLFNDPSFHPSNEKNKVIAMEDRIKEVKDLSSIRITKPLRITIPDNKVGKKSSISSSWVGVIPEPVGHLGNIPAVGRMNLRQLGFTSNY